MFTYKNTLCIAVGNEKLEFPYEGFYTVNPSSDKSWWTFSATLNSRAMVNTSHENQAQAEMDLIEKIKNHLLRAQNSITIKPYVKDNILYYHNAQGAAAYRNVKMITDISGYIDEELEALKTELLKEEMNKENAWNGSTCKSTCIKLTTNPTVLRSTFATKEEAFDTIHTPEELIAVVFPKNQNLPF